MEIGQSRGLPSRCLYDRTLPRQHRGRGLPRLRQWLGSAYIAGVDLLGAETFTYLARQGLYAPVAMQSRHMRQASRVSISVPAIAR